MLSSSVVRIFTKELVALRHVLSDVDIVIFQSHSDSSVSVLTDIIIVTLFVHIISMAKAAWSAYYTVDQDIILL